MKHRLVMLLPLTLLIFSVFAVCNKKRGTADPSTWSTDSIRIVKGNLHHVWEILWGPDDHIWYTERNGKISKVNPANGSVVFSATVSDVQSNNEGGLLGMALHPDFLSNGLLYVVYNYDGNNGYREKLVRFRLNNNALTDPTTLIDNIPASSIHNGSRVRIENDGPGHKIYFTTGDAANGSNSQDVNSRNGKVLRLNLDGSIPSDNPIAGNPMWSYGHRNAQGLIYVNNKWYSSEHGPSIEDELNIVLKGRNYGWPQVNGPCDGGEVNFCNSNDVVEPIWSSGNNTNAVCGIDYYNHDRIPQWKNSILMTTLKDQTLIQLKLSNDGNSVVSTSAFYRNQFGRLRDVCVSPGGRVYICTSSGGNQDKIIEISKL